MKAKTDNKTWKAVLRRVQETLHSGHGKRPYKVMYDSFPANRTGPQSLKRR